MRIAINVLGELEILRDGKPISLPTSKRTRALLAYLTVTARPHRRDRLCEVFWEIPDDPRGALRWSLSKIRQLVNDSDVERLNADRERVALAIGDIDIDVNILAQQLDDPDLSTAQLDDMIEKLNSPFLEGLELPDQELYQQWLNAERQEMNRLQGKALACLSIHPNVELARQLICAQKWETLEPFNPHAASRLLSVLDKLNRTTESSRLAQEFKQRFRNAGLKWSDDARVKTNQDKTNQSEVEQKSEIRQLLARQKVQFCTADDGTRIAYASLGQGSPIVKTANWLSHLEHDWDAPIWSPLFRDLATDHRFIRYDERGNGLSDWDVKNISFETFVTDLETVVDANKLDKFTLLGISQGAAVSIEYAIRHPDRVKQLVLFGGYAAGWRIGASEALIKEREAVMTLTATGWGQNNPAYRQIFSSTFLPSATSEEHTWFNEFQRLTTSPENAVRFLSVFSDIDVRAQLAKVKVPTLVIHSLGDLRIPVKTGRDIAASIPNAEFVGLESDGHLLLGREPASKVFVQTIRDFIVRSS